MRTRKVARKRSKTQTVYYTGFLAFVGLWVMMTLLCYFGVLVFDARSPGGAIVSGLILSASIFGAIKFLKMQYDDGVKTFRKKK